jgi:outer membrane protein
MLKYFTGLFFLLGISLPALAQNDNVWTLQRCVQYALDHNITIQQDVLNARLAKFTLLQSQLAQLPSFNASGSYGRSYGRSVDPTTNQFINADYDFIGLNGNSSVLLFGWFQQRNTIAKNKFSLLASKADLDQLKDDVSLNVATGYLRAILAKEQVHVSEKQVELSRAQLAQTRSFFEAGRLPELNVAQLESQLATDSSNLITNISNYISAILDLKTLLNLDFTTPLEVQAPEVKLEDQLNLSGLTPEQVYDEAHKHFGAIRSAEYKVSAAKKGLSSATHMLLPQLSFGAQLGTNWASTYQQISGYTISGLEPIGTVRNSANNAYDTVFSPTYTPHYQSIPTGTQLNNNFRQTYALTLSVPLFNGWQAQYGLRQARYNFETQKLNQYQAELTLKQNVYKSFNDARNSVEKYYAAVRAEQAAARAEDFAQKRYELGLTSTVDYLVTQNALYAAEGSLLSAKYDLIFKLKVIDYYLGKELKL